MEEFVEGFTEFRKWLHNELESGSRGDGYSEAICDVMDKFKECGLEDAW